MTRESEDTLKEIERLRRENAELRRRLGLAVAETLVPFGDF
jgi:hypothetical protein